MAKLSAGLVLYRNKGNNIEVLLVHPGGPFWAKKDYGVWSIPKGEFSAGEEPLTAAKREFSEELGKPVPKGDFTNLGESKQSSGKIIYAWAIRSDLNVSNIKSNTFKMEWPPKSGQMKEFPEVDRAEWFQIDTALTKILKGQIQILQNLATQLSYSFSGSNNITGPNKPSQPSLF